MIEYRDPNLDPERTRALKTTKSSQISSHLDPECTLVGEDFVTGSATATMSINPTSLREPWMKGIGFRPTSTSAAISEKEPQSYRVATFLR